MTNEPGAAPEKKKQKAKKKDPQSDGGATRPAARSAAARVRDYPPSPAVLPDGFLATPVGYLVRVVGVLIGLLLFVALYAGLIYATVMAFPALYSLDLGLSRAALYMMIGGTVVLLAVLVFLVKGLFHRGSGRPTGLLELERADEPELFAFIDGLVKETGAPAPGHVYVSGAVNAAVFYEPSLLSLVWPVQKNLLLGLGLVNHLTRSELKAILGHELGHFSQRSMKLGSYVYVTHGVVRGLVERDWFDDGLEAAMRSDARIAIVALVVQGFVWVIRGILRGVFAVLVFGHRALSREMEFAADRVAVAVAGSDAIARGLYKAELADACAAAAGRALLHAGDHGLHTADFFHHQARMVPEVRRQAERPDWGEVPAGSARFLFEEDTTSKPSMWATHPPSAERERAARARLVEAEHDERPAWTFFADPTALRERVTAAMRPEGAPKVERTSAEDVERFLEAERTEARTLDRFGEMFTGRPVAKLDLGAVFDEASTSTRAELEAELAAIPMTEIAELSARFRAARKEAELLGRARTGAVRDEALRFRGNRIEKSEIPRALARLDDDVKTIDRRFEKLDEALMRVHARLAQALSAERATTLRRRYALVLRLQSSLLGLRATHGRVVPYLAAMGSGQRLGEGDAQAFIARIEDLRNEIAGVLERAEGRKLPAMENVPAGTELAGFLLPRAMQPPRPEPVLTGKWIGQVLADSSEVSDKLERLHKKSIAGMVVMLDRIQGDWRAAGEVGAESAAAGGEGEGEKHAP